MKREKLILVGASGSGKDHLLRGLVKKGLKYQPKITTRPRRKLETEGVEYNFIEKQDFENLLENKKIKAYQDIKVTEDINWYYGISSENFERNHLFIMTPHEINLLSEKDRKDSFVVYLDIDESVRRERITKRSDNNDSVERRISSDKIDFRGFNKYDLKVSDPDFDIDDVYNLMS
jgi:guanylate kinase